MNQIVTTIFLLLSVSFASGGTNRPRGVSLKDSHLYDDNNEFFQCLDGSKNIPFESVNDDYCDCQDGSDEPGTSACSNGKFYCVNTGYVSKTVPSSMINDNICDCCDGSDEWESEVTCPNICDSLGAEAREKAAKKLEIVKEGWEKRKKLVEEAEKLFNEKKESIAVVRNEIDILKHEKESLEEELKPYEEREKQMKEIVDKEWDEMVKAKKMARAKKLFTSFDIDNDGKITLEEVKKIPQADSDGNNEVTDEEAKIFLHDNDEVDFEKFVNDVYDSVRGRTSIKPPQVEDIDDEKDVESEKEEKDTSDEEKKQGEEENGDEEKNKEEGHSKVMKVDLQNDGSEGHESDEDDDIGRKPEYDEETKAAISIAEEYREKVRKISDKIFEQEGTIRDDEKFLEMNFGEDKAWASLYKRCFEVTQKQYVYKVCLYEKATQKDTNGYGETSLGNWDNWIQDDVTPYKIQNYNNGQSCWNGPNRSTKVVVECGQETELVDATEPSKCEYLFTLKSPVACPDPSSINIHEEL